MNKRKLKGFTLVELIVVIAVFGILMAATLSLVAPASGVFKNTQQYASSTMLIDNVERAISDKIRYANRMTVRVGPIAPDADSGSYIDSQVTDFRKKFYLGDSVSGKTRIQYAKDRVYVIYINNPENFTAASNTFNTGSSNPPGKISLWVYDSAGEGVLNPDSREWVLAKGEYDDVSFSVSFKGITDKSTEVGVYDKRQVVNELTFNDAGTWISPSAFSMTLNIFDNKYNSARNKYELCKTAAVSEMPLALVNMAESGLRSSDIFSYNDGATVVDFTESTAPTRYDFTNDYKSNDIYMIFTLPEF